VKRAVTLVVNGNEYALTVAPNQTLLEVLRDELSLTGTKKGCDAGTCGACTVILEGKPVLSCLTLAIRCQGQTIQTIEGLAENGDLHPLQQMAIEHNAVQCGFCTPGWLLSAKVLLENNPKPTREDVRRAISGNLCRCTGYKNIEDAILSVKAQDHHS
jgi:carbon-monoxide dehydrogenase small subunit